ncbi:MarR family transcriptional regulator [Peptoniphilus asaccharolyticus]|uniref:MarR family transcriptional regulator n=1 Tax=Peptoniphilus asaccharolyticus TaxID=1258 RepID=UPI00061D61E8|nr:MarR family transcriptional regulator [Peptoniphilus asaccharolyticus]MBL7576448.1 MarR family transcriptional regulator [Peptoniphilus asaccharolyticus]
MNNKKYLVPKEIFNEKYKDLYVNSKLIYIILYNLTNRGKIKINFGLNDVQKYIKCSNMTATKTLLELEKRNLIKREKVKIGEALQITLLDL